MGLLAYGFWHWKRAEVDAAAYEDALIRFHRSLADKPPTGFIASRSTLYDELPWAGGSPCFEDWYFLEGSAALDVIDEAAVGPDHREKHEAISRLAAAGTAGLYRLWTGAAQPRDVRFVSWFAKPRELSYDQLVTVVTRAAQGREVALWGRRLVLGPTPEFALWSSEPLELSFECLRVEVRRSVSIR